MIFGKLGYSCKQLDVEMVERVNRLMLLFIDHIIASIVAFFFPSLLFIFRLEDSILFKLFWSLGVVLYLNKDIIGGKSYGKRILSYAIIIEGDKSLNSTICMLRNLTAPLFLIEIILLVINPEKRSIDYFLGTKVVRNVDNEISRGYILDWKGTLFLSAAVMMIALILTTIL